MSGCRQAIVFRCLSAQQVAFHVLSYMKSIPAVQELSFKEKVYRRRMERLLMGHKESNQTNKNKTPRTKTDHIGSC